MAEILHNSDIMFHIMGFIVNSDCYDVSVLSIACVDKTLNRLYALNQHFLLPAYLGFSPVTAAKTNVDCGDYSKGYITAFRNFHDLV